MRIIDGFQLFYCVSTDNHTRVVPYFTRGGPYTTQNMVQTVYDYPRRYTAKQLKTIYYSLIVSDGERTNINALSWLPISARSLDKSIRQMTNKINKQEIIISRWSMPDRHAMTNCFLQWIRFIHEIKVMSDLIITNNMMNRPTPLPKGLLIEVRCFWSELWSLEPTYVQYLSLQRWSSGQPVIPKGSLFPIEHLLMLFQKPKLGLGLGVRGQD